MTARRRARGLVLMLTAATLAGVLSACSGSSSMPGISTTPARSAPAGGAGVPTADGPSSSTKPATKPASPPPTITSDLGPTPAGGMVVERTIPSTDTFRPRPGFLYVPPILLTHPERRVPVLELLHGTPGEPSNWFTGGFLRETADAFAKAHGGLAPLVVVPDVNGARRADSQCIRTANGADVEHYLTSDVVRYVRDRYGMAVGTERWWIAGLSEGGICSAVLALRHPDLYSAFGDMSGLLRPTVDHLSLAGTNRQLYQDDPVAEREHDPQWLLSHRRYTAREGAWFLCGAQDVTVRRAQVVLVAASRRAGLLTHSGYLPGTHRWVVWSAALRLLLPWLWLNFGV